MVVWELWGAGQEGLGGHRRAALQRRGLNPPPPVPPVPRLVDGSSSVYVWKVLNYGMAVAEMIEVLLSICLNKMYCFFWEIFISGQCHFSQQSHISYTASKIIHLPRYNTKCSRKRDTKQNISCSISFSSTFCFISRIFVLLFGQRRIVSSPSYIQSIPASLTLERLSRTEASASLTYSWTIVPDCGV